MKKSEQKMNAYQLLLWDDSPMTEERKLWMSLFQLEEGQDKMRRRLFKEIGELKKENNSLKELLWEVRQSMQQKDLFTDLFAAAQ